MVSKGDSNQEWIQEKINFFGEVQLFTEWSLPRISAFCLQVESKIFRKNDYIYRKAEKSKYIYFIKSGEIEVHRN